MKRYRTVTKTQEVQELEEFRCDLCGKKGNQNGRWPARRFEVNDTELTVRVEHNDGKSYPEGGCGNVYSVDICPECFKGRLVAWLNSQGADIDTREWEW